MLKRLFVKVAVLSACAGAAMAQEQTPVELKAMSFNIRYGTAQDGQDAWEHRRDLVVETIQKGDPDVFGVQECLEFQAEYLAEHLEGYRWIGMGRDTGGLGEMTAVFYRREVLSPIEMRHFWLSEQPELPGMVSWDSSLTRMASWVRFYHREAHRAFNVVNTHFDHKGVIAREKSAEALAALVKELPQDQPLIIMGDFNSVAEQSVPWQTLINAGMQDSFLVAAEQEGPETTWSGFGKAVGREEPFRIDWILLRGPVEAERAEVMTYSKDGRYPSDHFPVTARLKLWPEAQTPGEIPAEDATAVAGEAEHPLERTR